MAADPGKPEDGQLVSRTLAGDKEAFAMLYDRYARLVRTVAWDAGGYDWTMDITQECFLRAFRKLATLRNPEHFRYWLVGIARQVVSETRRRYWPEPLGEPTAVAPEEARTLDQNDEIEHVLRLVARLPEQERLAIFVFFLGERNIAETARLLEMSRSGAYEVIKRACAKLGQWAGACQWEGRCNS